MKSNLLFELGTESLRTLLSALGYAEIKQSDLKVTLQFLLAMVNKLEVPEGKIVHWDNSQIELITANMTEITRTTLLMGKEVNRIRVAQHKPIKNFINEAENSDRMRTLLAKREEISKYERTVDDD